MSEIEWLFAGLIFIWSGFVRSGLGFGGAALALPLMLLVVNAPLFWLPMVAIHLLIFSLLTVYDRLGDVDWPYLKKSLVVLIIPKLIGVFGLINLPNEILVAIIYSVTFLYGLAYLCNYVFSSRSTFFDNLLLVMGGYASGVSLMGAPLISAVYARNVALRELRVTLFVLWTILVMIKMSTLVYFDVDLQVRYALYFLPLVAIGHWFGLKAHTRLVQGGGSHYKRAMGVALVVISAYGLLAAPT